MPGATIVPALIADIDLFDGDNDRARFLSFLLEMTFVR